MNVRQEAERLADNATLQVMARLAMLATPALLGALGYFGAEWLDGRFEAQAAVTNAVIEKVDGLEDEFPKLRERVVRVETNQERGRASRELSDRRSDELQRQTVARLDRLDQSILALSNAVAALTATVQASQNRRP